MSDISDKITIIRAAVYEENKRLIEECGGAPPAVRELDAWLDGEEFAFSCNTTLFSRILEKAKNTSSEVENDD